MSAPKNTPTITIKLTPETIEKMPGSVAKFVAKMIQEEVKTGKSDCPLSVYQSLLDKSKSKKKSTVK